MFSTLNLFYGGIWVAAWLPSSGWNWLVPLYQIHFAGLVPFIFDPWCFFACSWEDDCLQLQTPKHSSLSVSSCSILDLLRMDPRLRLSHSTFLGHSKAVGTCENCCMQLLQSTLSRICPGSLINKHFQCRNYFALSLLLGSLFSFFLSRLPLSLPLSTTAWVA